MYHTFFHALARTVQICTFLVCLGMPIACATLKNSPRLIPDYTVLITRIEKKLCDFGNDSNRARTATVSNFLSVAVAGRPKTC
jgi:hypothetical protein